MPLFFFFAGVALLSLSAAAPTRDLFVITPTTITPTTADDVFFFFFPFPHRRRVAVRCSTLARRWLAANIRSRRFCRASGCRKSSKSSTTPRRLLPLARRAATLYVLASKRVLLTQRRAPVSCRFRLANRSTNKTPPTTCSTTLLVASIGRFCRAFVRSRRSIAWACALSWTTIDASPHSSALIRRLLKPLATAPGVQRCRSTALRGCRQCARALAPTCTALPSQSPAPSSTSWSSIRSAPSVMCVPVCDRLRIVSHHVQMGKTGLWHASFHGLAVVVKKPVAVRVSSFRRRRRFVLTAAYRSPKRWPQSLTTRLRPFSNTSTSLLCGSLVTARARQARVR